MADRTKIAFARCHQHPWREDCETDGNLLNSQSQMKKSCEQQHTGAFEEILSISFLFNLRLVHGVTS